MFNGEPELFKCQLYGAISASSVYGPFESSCRCGRIFSIRFLFLGQARKAAAKLCSAYASTKDYRNHYTEGN